MSSRTFQKHWYKQRNRDLLLQSEQQVRELGSKHRSNGAEGGVFLDDKGDELREDIANQFLVGGCLRAGEDESPATLRSDVHGEGVFEGFDDMVTEFRKLFVVWREDVDACCYDDGGGHETVADTWDGGFASEPG